ncbi:M14 family metallopeptidase [Gillisia sp. M10.2A]|uniref:M14 family metallopeptidase n=1 Tax=Gillisia lutea TaxID=2909668 RepID=A0ABS9EFY8_9FLAO|nr:M14 metallopeptidase family protein [Gillisia lutea]MCF4101713.1 M14 family metallopeptidase [Gillisia lutea]
MKKQTKLYSNLIDLYSSFKEKELEGRYITTAHIEPILNRLKSDFSINTIGSSELGAPIYSIGFGKGSIKILAWSQMHGNESTTTKAIFDILNAFSQFREHELVDAILEQCTVTIIPILNPDGAQAYTRVNANNIDLNRDAKDLTQKESKVLRSLFNELQPDYCLNLHDQRTIFSAGDRPFPATISFLTPAMDEERSITESRIKSMKVISRIADDLKSKLPHQIGRYDDSYNANCTGDTYQSLNVPTLLFEAGHYKNDYQREKTREFVAIALLSAINTIANGSAGKVNHEEYFTIPENEKLFYDLIIRNYKLEGRIMDIAIQYKETLINDKVSFIPIIEKIADKLSFYGHEELDNNKKTIVFPDNNELRENVIVNKIMVNDEVFTINYEKK